MVCSLEAQRFERLQRRRPTLSSTPPHGAQVVLGVALVFPMRDAVLAGESWPCPEGLGIKSGRSVRACQAVSSAGLMRFMFPPRRCGPGVSGRAPV